MRLRFCWGQCLGEGGKQMHWDEGYATVTCRERAVITCSSLINRAALGTACWVFFWLSPDTNDCSACVVACQKSRLVFPANSVHLCKAGINETAKNCRVHLRGGGSFLGCCSSRALGRMLFQGSSDQPECGGCHSLPWPCPSTLSQVFILTLV